MTVAEARDAFVRSPDFWKVALVMAQTFPLLEDPDAEVWLFETKRAADDALRDCEKTLVAGGWKRRRGARSRGFVELALAGETIALGLDYPGRVSRVLA